MNTTIHYQRTIKMKPTDVKNDSFAEYNEKPNEKDPKFKVNDHVRISKYKDIFPKGYAPNRSEKIFVFKNIKNTIPWTYVIHDVNDEDIVESFSVKALQNVKWKGYDNYFNT